MLSIIFENKKAKSGKLPQQKVICHKKAKYK